jgi:hypothetical protein
MWKTVDGGSTAAWTPITLPVLTNSITYITVHPTDPNTVWFTVGGYTSGQKVYESTNGGASWTEIGTGLPNLPIMSIVHYKKATDRNVLFVGTDLGVYVKDGANAWATYSNNLPNVVVSELEIYYNPSGTDKLRAGTYGRGLWETDIDAALPVELSSFSVNSAKGANASIEWETITEVNNYGFEIERKPVELALKENDRNWETIGFVKGNGNSNSRKFYSFMDKNIDGGSKFAYRLKQLDINGQFEYSDVIEINLIPDEYLVNQNYPNPFNPTTKISYRLPVRSDVKLTIFNVLGKEVNKLINDVKEAGLYSIEFDASNLPSGVYYYTLSAGDFKQTKKMMLVK